MPLHSSVKFLATLLSVVVLGVAAYLLWTWYEGDQIVQPDGTLIRLREDWRLWVPLLAGFLLWRPPLVLLLAGADPGERSKQDRGAGQIREGANGTKPEASQSISQQSCASLRVIEGCNHMGFLEGHEDYNREIVAFARQVTRPTTLNDNERAKP
jgi:pimeloyl-ACP methyl ester carboxylesterase